MRSPHYQSVLSRRFFGHIGANERGWMLPSRRTTDEVPSAQAIATPKLWLRLFTLLPIDHAGSRRRVGHLGHVEASRGGAPRHRRRLLPHTDGEGGGARRMPALQFVAQLDGPRVVVVGPQLERLLVSPQREVLFGWTVALFLDILLTLSVVGGRRRYFTNSWRVSTS